MLLKLSSLLENKKTLQYIAVPLLAVGVYLFLIYIYKMLGLPSHDEILGKAEDYYGQYGYIVVLVGALVEGALFVNWYLPGSIVVALGVVLAKGADLNVFLVLACVVIGFFLTALLNYALGYFGWYHVFLKLGLKSPLEKIQSKVEEKGLKILFTTYIHPNFGALAATAAGILRLPFRKFFVYSFLSILVWNNFWTAVFYYFGGTLINHVNLLIIVAGLFVYFMFFKSFKKSHINVP